MNDTDFSSSHLFQLGEQRRIVAEIVDEGGWNFQQQLDELDARIEHALACSTWYRDQVELILALVSDQGVATLVEFDDDMNVARVSRSASARDLLHVLRVHTDPAFRLRLWCDLLVSRGMLDATDLKTFGVQLEPPVSAALVKIRETERAKRVEFDRSFEALRRAVIEHRVSAGDSRQWAEKDFLNVWNRGDFLARFNEHDALVNFTRELSSARPRLLPVAYGAIRSIQDLLKKIGGAQ